MYSSSTSNFGEALQYKKEQIITIAFHCKTTLKICTKSDPLSIKMKCFDILQDIRNRLEILPIEVSWRWVEGHQKEKGKKMDWWARRNFDVDLAAKSYLKVCRKAKRPFKPIQLKDKYWVVYCKNVKQSNVHPENSMNRFFIPKQQITGTPTAAPQCHCSVIFTAKPITLQEKSSLQPCVVLWLSFVHRTLAFATHSSIGC